MPITPPIFIRADELLVFDSVAQAESCLEPVDVQPDERGYDAEGRALFVRVVGEVKHRWIWIDQSGARVEIVLAEDTPAHAEELRSVLASWLSELEGAPVTASLAELVERGRKYVYR